VPKYYLYYNISGLYYMSSCWLNELCMRLNLQFVVIWYIEYSFFFFCFQHLLIYNSHILPVTVVYTNFRDTLTRQLAGFSVSLPHVYSFFFVDVPMDL